jgi:uncharacterized protein with PIN domain
MSGMTLRLYIDEDSMRHSLVRALRVRGVDVVTPLDTGTVGYEDARQLEWAEREGRVLFSANCSDFCRLHKEFHTTGRHHSGIVLVQQGRFSIGETMRRLLRLMAARSAEEMRDQVEFLGAWG